MYTCAECGRQYDDGRKICDSDDCPGFMTVERAMKIVYSLAEQNALSKHEVHQEPALYDEFNKQHDALEIVEAFMDNNLNHGELCKEYDCGVALEVVHELARDNILDEFIADQDEALEEQRHLQQQACDVIEDFIVNHYGES